jgi:general secretion pathway protein L
MRKIIIYFETTDLSQLSWLLVNEQSAPEQIILHGTLSELAQAAKNHPDAEIIGIATPADVLLTTAKLPKLNRQRLLQALPYALEEQLLTDVNELHFATGEYSEAGLPVAIIAKTTLNTWLATLKENGIAPTIIIPAPLAMLYTENQWHIKIFGDSALVRTGPFCGFACDKNNLDKMLELKLADTTKPQAIFIDNYTTEQFPKATQNFPEREFISGLIKSAGPPTLNLLQGAFQAKRKSTDAKKIWVLTAYVIGALLAVILCCNFISLLVLQHKAATLDTAIASIYKHNFPHATAIVSPKSRMSERLSLLANDNHKNRLLVWLAYLGKSMTQVKSLIIKQLDFRNNQLSLELFAPDLASLDTLTHSLQEQGLQVKQQNVTAVGKTATGTLIITDGDGT